MLSFHAQLKVFVATAPCDLRLNFNGLWAAARQQLGEDPKSGALFVFGNRRRNRIKIRKWTRPRSAIKTGTERPLRAGLSVDGIGSRSVRGL